jgi:signal peptidase II
VSDGVATAASAWRFRLGGLRWVPLSLLVILLDQATKAVIESSFELFDVKPILPFLEFTLLYNTGAAFSFLAGASGWQRWFFIGLGVIVSIVILYWLKRLEPGSQRMLAAGFALILGGALGNVIDRVRYGAVVDFLDFHLAGWHWPAFNVADSAICIGAAFLVADSLLAPRRQYT